MNLRALAAGFALVFLSPSLMAEPSKLDFKGVDDAVAKGLPKTAIEQLEPMLPAAIEEQRYAFAVHALVRKIGLESELQGGGAEEKITRLQTEIVRAPGELQPILQTVMAEWYWQYFQDNRWKFAERTQQAGAVSGEDLRTWDLVRILSEVDRRFTIALGAQDALKKIPISEYNDLLDPGTAPDAYRPTLYDFVAHQALDFYQVGEQAGAKSESDFEIEASGPIFDPLPAFLAWKPANAGDNAPSKAIALYQQLMVFHRSDAEALADLDLSRIIYGSTAAVGENRDDRYVAALEHVVTEHPKEEFAARALARLSDAAAAKLNFAQAHRLAEQGVRIVPNSIGSRECQSRLYQLEAKQLTVETESVWTAPWPKITVQYRNLNKIYFRAVEMDFDAVLAKSRWNARLSREDGEAVLLKTPALSWAKDLNDPGDYAEHTASWDAPSTLRPGFYAIVASADAHFGETQNWMSVATIWVSDVALVLRNENGGGLGGFVLRARDGTPMPKAKIQTYIFNRRGAPQPSRELIADENGHFQTSQKNEQIFFVAQKDDQRVASLNYLYNFNRDSEPREQLRIFFFLDRAIYRPGQTINYKGIALRGIRQNKFKPAAKESVTVVLRDVNRQEIARTSLTTNDVGSFSGVFTAPRDRLNGRMFLQIEEGQGVAAFNIEEYKRPKFQVAISAPALTPKLDDEITVVGRATAYTGASVGGARVAWRVQREVSWPSWFWWYGGGGTSKALAHGTAVTNADGTFSVRFKAEPDRTVSTENEPAFVYRVYADVTDISGETRSTERAVTVGYTALRAALKADEWLNSDRPVKLTVTTTSLDGEPTAAEGEIVVYEVKQPDHVERTEIENRRISFRNASSSSKPALESWAIGRKVEAKPFRADKNGVASLQFNLPAGVYRAELATKDRFGKTVTARRTLSVVDPKSTRLPIKIPELLAARSWSIQPGDTFSAIWGTGYAQGRAFVEILCANRTLQSYWTDGSRTQSEISQPVTEEMRGGFTVRTTFVAENRLYVNERIVDVPWTNKELHLSWESFRSKLEPGAKEIWSLRVTGPDAKRASAEMVATLYDASLDQFAPHSWPSGFDVFRREEQYGGSSVLQNSANSFEMISWWPQPNIAVPAWSYRHFPETLNGGEYVVLSPFEVASSSDKGYKASEALAGTRLSKKEMRLASRSAPGAVMPAPMPVANNAATLQDSGSGPAIASLEPPDLSQVSARKNLTETAFFFPQLTTDADGVVRIQFTMPEALTQWKFLGFAHDRELRAGLLTDTVVTSKDLMVEPNAPRFVREGDVIEFSVKVTNQSDAEQTGSVQLTFAEAASLRSVDRDLQNLHSRQDFSIPAKQSRNYTWKISIPDGLPFLTYKAVAAVDRTSDGEEGYLPILSRRIPVTESLPISVRGPGTKSFTFEKLAASGSSATLRNQALTVQMTSQPAWNAVLSLPYLMEYPYECSEQLFNRFYANALGAEIANSDPKIRRVFDQWKNTPALQSPLQKNEDLKSVALQETPWVLDAQSESVARQRVGLLFDENRLADEGARALKKLAERQESDGLWPWFPGGPASDYISLYIVTGFGRLRHLGAKVDVSVAKKALGGLDASMAKRYREIQKDQHPEEYRPSGEDILYLYGRSFFLDDQPIDAAHQEALNFFRSQAKKFWVQLDSRQSQAQLAVALQRFGDRDMPQAIVKSLKERSLRSDDQGRYWREPQSGWWFWAQAPIETQAMMIEAFDEVAHDQAAVDDCRIWLLQQKRTQDWRTTKATADAIYALLLRGSSLLGDQRVSVELGGQPLVPEKVEAGTGYFEQKFVRGEIKPEMASIRVTKPDAGLSYGSVTWQYLEDVSKITAASTNDGLSIKKTLFVKTNTAQGPTLVPVRGAVSIGDELVVRIELRVERDLEFVHLKDQRGSGTEPVSVLSQYKYQDGTGYYESTRDTATHFFFDSLRRGVYAFEYSTRVQLAGRYESGLADVQCMYAPEFNAHSESVAIEAQR